MLLSEELYAEFLTKKPVCRKNYELLFLLTITFDYQQRNSNFDRLLKGIRGLRFSLLQERGCCGYYANTNAIFTGQIYTRTNNTFDRIGIKSIVQRPHQRNKLQHEQGGQCGSGILALHASHSKAQILVIPPFQ